MGMSAVPQLPDDVHDRLKKGGKEALTVVLSGGCNLKCTFCGLGSIGGRGELTTKPDVVREQAVLTVDVIKRWMERLHDAGRLGIMLIAGEEIGMPAAWPQFVELVQWCTEHGVPWATISNMTMIGAERAKFIVEHEPVMLTASLDGPKDWHNNKRGEDWAYEKCIAGIHHVRDAGLPPDRLSVASIAFGNNPAGDEWLAIKDLAQEVPSLTKIWMVTPHMDFQAAPPEIVQWEPLVGELSDLQATMKAKDVTFRIEQAGQSLPDELNAVRWDGINFLRIDPMNRVSPTAAAFLQPANLQPICPEGQEGGAWLDEQRQVA